ncbi:YcdB/YcdC domain-containing protein [Metabacillus idriensis]|uniref:YcdB/YcdC domain-containing protein n=1 Tax=Metabacillus idriensis TaxID=324768 RepID=UPI00174E1300|nr:YcdB/YcdC domain-containing protein [Metabacillus idriensis]
MHKKDILKKKARQICVIPSEYKLEIEDYSEDRARAVFAWKHPDEEDMGIWIELDGNGQLIDFTKDKSTEEMLRDILNQEDLIKKALQFTEIHYPGVISKFKEERVQKIEERLRVSYIQMELDLPLPFTGFYIDINEYGEIMQFHYDGAAEHIVFPECLQPEEKVRGEFLKDIQMNLMIVSLNEELYENGDNLPHLVYEPELRFYEVPADGGLKVLREQHQQEEPEPEPAYKNLSKFEFLGSPEVLTNLDADFTKIREQDLGDAIGLVYRKDGDEPAAADDSIMTFFNKRNENTIKVKRDKETGKLLGFVSFYETSGNQLLSIKECERTAVQFLNAIYPNAHLYFMMDQEIESDEERALFQFDLIHYGISVRYGTARINVNRTSGKITHYLGPEVEPKLLISVNRNPGISKENAIELFSSVFKVEQQWTKEYKDHSESYYQLVYKPVYPLFKGNLSFIDAKDGEFIVEKGF